MGKYETIERVDELFRLQEDGGLTEWQCPACADTCECAACWRKRHPNTGANIPKPNSSNSPSTTDQTQTATPQQTVTTNTNSNNNISNIPQFGALPPPNTNAFNMSNMPPTI